MSNKRCDNISYKMRHNQKVQNILYKSFNIFYSFNVVFVVAFMYFIFSLFFIYWTIHQRHINLYKNVSNSTGISMVHSIISSSFFKLLIPFLVISLIYLIMLYLKKSVGTYIFKKQETVIIQNILCILGEYVLVMKVVGNNIHTLFFGTVTGFFVEIVIYTVETLIVINNQKLLEEKNYEHKKQMRKLNDIYLYTKTNYKNI